MNEALVGTWRMTDYEVRSEDGEVSHPGGLDPEGYLIYSESGYFSTTIMEGGPERIRFASNDLKGGTDEELAEAAKSFIAYCGKYTVGDGTVTHHIELSLFPNWVKTDQLRYIEFENGKLLLSTPPFLIKEKKQKAYLILEKVSVKDS